MTSNPQKLRRIMREFAELQKQVALGPWTVLNDVIPVLFGAEQHLVRRRTTFCSAQDNFFLLFGAAQEHKTADPKRP